VETSNNNQHLNPLEKLFKGLSKVEPSEIKSTSVSFALGMILMASYYLLRPVRDAMSSDWSDAELSTLWTINFLFSFVVIAVYSFFASRVSVKKLVSGVYLFFAFTFFLFFASSELLTNTLYVDKGFYVWVSVFSLFQISVFWSFMSSIFNQEQSKRLFGVITSGASIGAIIGPSIPLLFSGLGTYNLMLIASVVLILTFPLVSYLHSHSTNQTADTLQEDNQSVIGGGTLSGFKSFFSNPFLLAIGLFLFLYTGISSFIYFELKNLMTDISREQRTEIWAFMDLATNLLTILAGLFLTSRIATRFGIGITLAILPFVVLIGMLSIILVPLLAVVVGLQIFRRGGNYAITRPAREMLFTYVDQETRFKAKQVIDVVVYRGGDVFWAWGFTFLTTAIGLGIAGVAAVGALIAGVWTALGLYLGRKTEEQKLQE